MAVAERECVHGRKLRNVVERHGGAWREAHEGVVVVGRCVRPDRLEDERPSPLRQGKLHRDDGLAIRLKVA
jgi:hypothetical protein